MAQTSEEAKAAEACPVCARISIPIGDAPGWGRWLECTGCGLEFVNPLTPAEDPTSLYERAYAGEENRSGMLDFAYRVRARKALLSDPTLWFWTPAFGIVRENLKSRLQARDSVLEVGCGLGFFLHVLRNDGFNVAGVDVARIAVELNRRDGFRVWHGTIETLPDDWIDPKAVLLMFMLHHLDNPLRFLRTIRSKWPRALLVIAQYGPNNVGLIRSQPPRTLTRWSTKSLMALIEAAGYRGSFLELESTGVESPLFAWAHPFLEIFKQLSLPDWAYRMRYRLENRILPKALGSLRLGRFVLVGFADAEFPTP